MENKLTGRLIALDPVVVPVETTLGEEACTLGRADSCTIAAARRTVSRLHARIIADGPRFLLHDASSANGTFVNGRRINGPHLLTDRDEIGLGAATPLLRFVDPDPTQLPGNHLQFDERSMRFTMGGRPLDLTPNEFRLLHDLYSNSGSIRSREACATAIWGTDYAPGMDADALDRVVSNLRRKLRAVDPESELIRTRQSLGYELIP